MKINAYCKKPVETLENKSKNDSLNMYSQWRIQHGCFSTRKCFTCVTKNIANLATYSRKPENYNGTIIFEFDIRKNSSPINLNLCQT